MKRSLSILAVLLCAFACIYPYHPAVEDAPEGILVIEGNLTVGDQATVRIGFLQSVWGEVTQKRYTLPADCAVWAEDDAATRYPGVPDPDDETRFTLALDQAPADRAYRLCVHAEGRDYSSDWATPLAAPVIKSVNFYPNEEKVFVYVSLDCSAAPSGYAVLSYDETWRFHASFYPGYEYDAELDTVIGRIGEFERYWCWMTSDQEKVFPLDYTLMKEPAINDYPLLDFSRYSSRNHQRYSLQVKARTINKANYLYLNNLAQAQDNNDLFTPNPGEMQGNLRCDTDPDRMVLGYVTVSQIARKRVFIGSEFLKVRALDPYELSFPQKEEYAETYERGYWPLVETAALWEDPQADRGDYAWGPPRCFDCTVNGGSLEKPDYWEE